MGEFMHITQRNSILGFLVLMSIGGFIVAAVQYITNDPFNNPLVTLGEALVITILLVAYWRGWEPARYIVVAFMTLMFILTQTEFALTNHLHLELMLPPVMALVFLPPLGIALTGLSIILGLLFGSFWVDSQLSPIDFILYSVLIGGMVIARMVLENALKTSQEARMLAEHAAKALEEANAQLETQVQQRTLQLQKRTDEQAELVAEQAKLLQELELQQSTIRSLSVPVIPVSSNTVVLPLVGTLDSERLNYLQQEALKALQELSARRMVLDITGVPVVDTIVAKGILAVVQAARLLGADVMLVGIRPEVAQTIVGHGMDLEGLRTYRDLAGALEQIRAFAV
jgi:rsbT co-antagonist protein RsbR